MREGLAPRARRTTLCLCTVAWLMVHSGSAAAQRASAPNASAASEGPSQAETEVQLRDRNREAMHPDQPLMIVGREQGGNDLRSRTPALAQGDLSIALVNEEENYRRTLAMYEDGAVFDHAPVSITVPVDEADRPPLPARAGNSAIVPERRSWPWVLTVSVVALAALLWVKRFGWPTFTRAPQTPSKGSGSRR